MTVIYLGGGGGRGAANGHLTRQKTHWFTYEFFSYCSLDLGTCRFGFGFGGTGKKSNNKQFDDYGGPFGKADVIGCHLDLESLGKGKGSEKGP